MSKIKITGKNYDISNSPEKLAEFTAKLIHDEAFRTSFNKNPVKKMSSYGIKVKGNFSPEAYREQVEQLVKGEAGLSPDEVAAFPAALVRVGVKSKVTTNPATNTRVTTNPVTSTRVTTKPATKPGVQVGVSVAVDSVVVPSGSQVARKTTKKVAKKSKAKVKAKATKTKSKAKKKK